MKKYYLSLIIIFFFKISVAQIPKDSVVYENIGSRLILYDDNTFIYKKNGLDISKIIGIGDDTITYGKYVRYKEKALYLYSHPDIQSSQMQIRAKEGIKTDVDSIITIILSSPFSKQQKTHPQLLKDAYFYFLEITFSDEEDKNLKHSQVSFSDTILILNTGRYLIKEITILIYPYGTFFNSITPYYAYLSLEYTPESIYSNLFFIDIPAFTACYINYDRFYGKEIEILDSCTIGIDKKYLLSKCIGNLFNEEWDFIIHQLRNPYEYDEWGNEID